MQTEGDIRLRESTDFDQTKALRMPANTRNRKDGIITANIEPLEIDMSHASLIVPSLAVSKTADTPDRRVAAHAAQHCTNVAPPIASTRI
jgi:hypothetical protein